MIRPLIAAVLLVAASPVLADCPSTGLARAPATFVTAKGKFRYTLEIAASGEEQECGLMHRKTMHRRAGMIFPFVQPRLASFWMENTPLPLDLIFVDAVLDFFDDTILNIVLVDTLNNSILDIRVADVALNIFDNLIFQTRCVEVSDEAINHFVADADFADVVANIRDNFFFHLICDRRDASFGHRLFDRLD